MAYIGFKDGGFRFDFTDGELLGTLLILIVGCGVISAILGIILHGK